MTPAEMIARYDEERGLPYLLGGGWINHTDMHNVTAAAVGRRFRIPPGATWYSPDHRDDHRTLGRFVRILVPDMPPEPPIGGDPVGDWHRPHHEWLIEAVRRLVERTTP